MKKKLLLLSAFVLLNIPFISHAECMHDWGDYRIIEAATCGESGEKERYCKLCNERESVIIPATNNHKWSDWVVTIQPGCVDSSGEEQRRCSSCGDTEERTIQPYPSHDWSEWTITEKSTCGDYGWMERVCKRCGEKDSDFAPLDPSNHVLSEWETVEDPTALYEGTQERSCDCGLICEERPIPKLKAKVKLSKSKISIKLGKSAKIRVKQKTRGDYIKKWKSSNKNIVSVTSSGKLKTLKKGTATITVIMESNAKAKCKVTVK